MERKGFIQSSVKPGSYSKLEYAVSPKGIAFLEEHRHFELEMPTDGDEIPHWVRFEGTVYKPNPKAGSYAANRLEPAAHIDYGQWTHDLEIALQASIQRGGKGMLHADAPATVEELAAVEAQLGTALPESFKRVLSGYAKKLQFYWHVPESEACRLDSGLTLYNGGLFDDGLWDLDKLAEYTAMIEDLDYLDDDYRQHWSSSLVFARDGMGSYYAIDLKYNVGEVIYLAHDGHYHGWRLGQDFETFWDNWIRIGCAGAFVTDFIAFSAHESPYISEKTVNSATMKAWLALKG